MTTKELVKELEQSKLPVTAQKIFDGLKKTTEDFEKNLTAKINIGSHTKTPKQFLKDLHAKFNKPTPKTPPKTKGARSLVERLTNNIMKETGSSYKKSRATAEKIIKQRGLFKGRTDRGIRKDAKQSAKKFGKRISKNGKVYYEYRSNRADVPVDPKYPKLERGGLVGMEDAQIYVASMKDYNKGKPEGAWINLTKHDSGSDVAEAIANLLDGIDKKHARPEGYADEYEVHDFKGFPKEFFSANMNVSEFNKLITFLEAIRGNDLPLDVIKNYAKVANVPMSEIEAKIDSAYRSTSSSTDDFTLDYVIKNGLPEDRFQFFDYSALGMTLRKGFNKAEFELTEDESDEDIAKEYLTETYADKTPRSVLETYFDSRKYWNSVLADQFHVIDYQQVLYFFDKHRVVA